MNVYVSAKPHLLLETVELLYAYVNQVAPEKLTSEGAYCLPAETVRVMMEETCAHISPTDPMVQYYFRKYDLPGEPKLSTCIARNIVYNVIFVSLGSVEADCARILELRQGQIRSRAQFSCIGEYRLDTVDFTEGQALSLESELSRLNVEHTYRNMLLELFQDFNGAVFRLQELVMPVARKLEPLLEPWARQAEPLAEVWRVSFEKPGAVDETLNRLNLKEGMGVNALMIQFRYFLPKGGQGMLYAPELHINLHMGVAVPVEPKEVDSFSPSEFKALRLLGNEDCMRMLRAMLDRPMSSREMARMLNIPLGTVCRNVSSMYDSGLLLIETVDGWKRYCTNMKTLSLICEHIMSLERFKLF